MSDYLLHVIFTNDMSKYIIKYPFSSNRAGRQTHQFFTANTSLYGYVKGSPH